MFPGVIHGFNLRPGSASILSVAVGSTVLALAVYTWWKKRSGSEDDDEMFNLKDSILFNPDVKFPQRSSVDSVSYAPVVPHTASVSTEERNNALNLARNMLRQLYGATYDVRKKTEVEDSSDSEETNVSLNYHIATELEKEARDSLVEAVVQSEVLKLEGQGRVLKPEDCVDVLHRAVEYLDISSEQEKLRQRRTAMHLNGSRDQRILWGGSNKGMELVMEQRRAFGSAYVESFARGVEIDHRLREITTNNHSTEERFEMDWEADDDDDAAAAEADLMAYLDEDDEAGYSNMMDARMAAMQGMDMGRLDADGVMYDDGDDYSGEEEEECEEDEIDAAIEKAGFERMLLDKLYQLSEKMGGINVVADTTGNSLINPQELTTTLEKNNIGEGGMDEPQCNDDDDEWETESDAADDDDADAYDEAK